MGEARYLRLRSEDLASSDIDVRYGVMRSVASFVGSSLRSEELCCIALQEEKSMGTHDRRKKDHVTAKKVVPILLLLSHTHT